MIAKWRCLLTFFSDDPCRALLPRLIAGFGIFGSGAREGVIGALRTIPFFDGPRDRYTDSLLFHVQQRQYNDSGMGEHAMTEPLRFASN
jgi:hypothetical protein